MGSSKQDGSSQLTVGMTDEWFEKEGMRREPEAWEDGSRVDNEPGRFEWWYFDAHLDDGSIVVAMLFSKYHSNIQVPCTPLVQLSITAPDGKIYANDETFTKADFYAETSTCDVQVGKTWIRGDLEHYTLHFEVKDMAADLTLERIVPSWRPGTGKCYFGRTLQDYFGWIVPVPYGRVTGTITYNGAAHEVSGVGYHDHNFGNIAITKIIDHWYWGRLTIADYNSIFFQLISTKKYGSEPLPLFMFAKGSEMLTGDGSKLAIEEGEFIKHAGGKSYPKTLAFRWQDGDRKITISLSNPQVIESNSLLKGFSPLKRAIARLLVNPYYFRFNADTDLAIEFDDIHDNQRDKAIYENMLLR
jgi:hypothetical protein